MPIQGYFCIILRMQKKGNSRTVFNFLRWNKTSYALLSGFLALIGLILYVWWPLAEEYISLFTPDIPVWKQLDYLLVGNFLVMTVLIMGSADLRHDLPLAFVGLAGGLVIEAWGTQTGIWSYYTNERPPLWIVPAWPIATLSIDRLYRILDHLARRLPDRVVNAGYWVIFGAFLALMIWFVLPTLDKSLTVMAVLLCLFLYFTPTNKQAMLFIFLMGAALGYFLERWGTSRVCWTYYTGQTPPVFAVFAHGMASVAFWRANKAMLFVFHKFSSWDLSFNRQKAN